MKKFLSMALALVMSLSLCAVVASPKASADFEDADELSSQYAVQAADVIQKIEVMDGYDDGTFRPAAGLTRQAAAKIICNMILGPTTARALPTNANPFPDVLAGNQFSGYISYCAQQGIISGYGDGTFRPGDPLSGYAYLKMLLGALGYDATHEGFVGDNWKVNVAKIALGIGLNEGIDDELDGTTQVTRESAAIYAFNTLQADMVEYESQNTLEINGVKVSMGGGKAVPQTWSTSSTSANNINDRKDDGTRGGGTYPIVQFAERYFDKLERFPKQWDTYTPDDFGRPSIRWEWKGVEIGTYSRDPDATFVGGVKVNAIYEALGMSSGDDSAYLYINSSIPNNRALNVARSNDKDLDHASNLNKTAAGISTGPDGAHNVDRIGDGTRIECFRNDADNHVDVCVISMYGGKVDAVKGATAKKDAYVVITYGAAPQRPDTIANGNGRDEFETEDFEEDDVVAYTYSDSAEEIKDMYLLSSESGVLTSRVSGKSLTLDDVRYSYGKEYTFDDMVENDLSSKSSYVVYLDENDYVLWIEEDEFAVDQYVLIERITIETKTAAGAVQKTASTFAKPLDNSAIGNSSWNVEAVVRYSSGSRRTVSLDDSKNYRVDVTGGGTTLDPRFYAGRIARISSNSNGYRLHGLDSKYVFKAVNFALDGKNATALNVETNTRRQVSTPTYTLREDNNGNYVTDASGNYIRDYIAGAQSETLIIDSETNFVIEDTTNDTYKSYVGNKNVPEVKADANNNYTATAYVYHRGALAKLIFVTAANSVSSSSKDVVFLAANSLSNLVDSDDGYYYDISAVDKDEFVTLRIKQGATFTANNNTLTPGVANTDKEWNCVILNNVTYDSNDLITAGYFDRSKIDSGKAQGIRRVNDEEVRLGTANANSHLHDVAENVRVFFVDGDDIDQIDYYDIVNDTQDWVYYVEDDEEITYLFIVDYEPDGAVVTPTTTFSLLPSDTTGMNYTYKYRTADGAPSYNAVLTALQDMYDARISNSGGTVTAGGPYYYLDSNGTMITVTLVSGYGESTGS